jgi:hypothetical protein
VKALNENDEVQMMKFIKNNVWFDLEKLSLKGSFFIKNCSINEAVSIN